MGQAITGWADLASRTQALGVVKVLVLARFSLPSAVFAKDRMCSSNKYPIDPIYRQRFTSFANNYSVIGEK